MLSTEMIAALGASIVGPILGYLKVREDRLKTADKRDAREQLMDRRLADVEVKVQAVEEVKQAINGLNITLTRIETTLKLYVKNCDRIQCQQDRA